MLNEKPWYLSKTIWSGLVMVIISVLSMLGITLPEGTEQNLTEIILSIVGAVAGGGAIYGRMSANSKIG